MTQLVSYSFESVEYEREIADSTANVIPGVLWGDHWVIFTPAYWLSQFWMNGLDRCESSPYKSSGSLAQEITFCLLGGFGITAELATAAFKRCDEHGHIANLEADARAWTETLRQPLTVEGKIKRYRFPNQKSRFLANAMQFLRENSVERFKGRKLRDELLKINGIGPKTAGWVVRNIDDSDDVAILDIHLVRAGQLCGLFSENQKVERDYPDMESRFLEFSAALGVRPSVLDCLIWDQMRLLGNLAIQLLNKDTVPTNADVQSDRNAQYGLIEPLSV